MSNHVLLRLAAISLAAISLTGCPGFRVSDNADSGGIPFVAKIPIETHVTKRVVPVVSIDVNLVSADDKKSISIAHIPEIVATSAVLVEVQKLDNLAATSADIQSFGTQLAALKIAATAASSNSPPSTVVENHCTVEIGYSSKSYYIQPITPLFGSNNASFTLSQDGTLSKADTNVTDSTASTLLALLPINPWLQKKWALTSSSKAALGALGMDPAATWQIEYLKSNASRVYTLKQRITASDESNNSSECIDSLAPLELSGAKVQITSVETIAASKDRGDDEQKAKAKGNAWQINGTVVMPTAPTK